MVSNKVHHTYPLKKPCFALRTSVPYRTARRRMRLRTYSRPSLPTEQGSFKINNSTPEPKAVTHKIKWLKINKEYFKEERTKNAPGKRKEQKTKTSREHQLYIIDMFT